MFKSKKKPVILFTRPQKGGHVAAVALYLAIFLAGGKGKRITSACNYKEILKKLDFQGLILSGGTDVHPELYHEDPLENYIYDPPRDSMEAFLLRYAEEKDMPVLGICRGAQLMNILKGGSLHLDIEKFYEKETYPSGLLARIFYRKMIEINKDSFLRKVLGSQYIKVNSMHTQAVDSLGEGLSITARELNGIVQCVEDLNHHFFIGVQFHPEYMIHLKAFRRIFKSLVEAAKKWSEKL